MAYYALIVLTVLIFALCLVFALKNYTRSRKILNAQSDCLKKHPKARLIETQSGLLKFDLVCIFVFLAAALMELAGAASSSDGLSKAWSVFLFFGGALGYLGYYFRRKANSRIILGPNEFMTGEEAHKYKDVISIDTYKNHYYFHMKHSILDLDQKQAEILEEELKSRKIRVTRVSDH